MFKSIKLSAVALLVVPSLICISSQALACIATIQLNATCSGGASPSGPSNLCLPGTCPSGYTFSSNSQQCYLSACLPGWTSEGVQGLSYSYCAYTTAYPFTTVTNPDGTVTTTRNPTCQANFVSFASGTECVADCTVTANL